MFSYPKADIVRNQNEGDKGDDGLMQLGVMQSKMNIRLCKVSQDLLL